MHFLKTYGIFFLLSTALLLFYCTSPTKSKKKTEQSVVFDDIWFSDEVDDNENGYYSSVRFNFSVRVTYGSLDAHILMALYSGSAGDDSPVGGGFWEAITLSESSQDFYITISEYPKDDYWINIWVIDIEDEEKVYAHRTPNTDPELGDLKFELPEQDVAFYLRLNNYAFTDIELMVDDGEYYLPVQSTLKIDYSGNPGSITLNGVTYGKTGDTQEQIGLDLYWEDVVRSTIDLDSLVLDLTINSDFFFLYMYNGSGYDWSPIDVNVGQASEDYFRENIRIPADYQWYSTGYYRKFYNTRVDAYYEDYPEWSPIVWENVEFNPFWPDKYSNSSFTAALSYPSSAKINSKDVLLKALPIGGTREISWDIGKVSKLNGSHGIDIPNTGAR